MSVVLYVGINWKVGDFIWCKYLNWPYWPAMVLHDHFGHYKDGDNIRVCFVDSSPTTAWVNSK